MTKPRNLATPAPVSSTAAYRSAAGFTLIELSVVVLILALVASAAVLSLRAPYESARLENTLQRVTTLDGQLRRHTSRTQRPLLLQIDVERSTLQVRNPDGASRLFAPLKVGVGARIDQVTLLPGRIERKAISVPFTSRGSSPSYALRIRPADGQSQWLVFAGLTGQCTRMTDDEQIKHLARSQPGPDAP